MIAKIRELNLDEVKNVAGGAIVSATAVVRPTATVYAKPTTGTFSGTLSSTQLFAPKLI